ncbi:MAG: cytochrome c class [Deltaproteobacteria bacterium]|jgi:mono/diheme cytochrome c family protein|nr:cytochrome c class [Deltaproteobacteria bacterium]
MNKTQILKIGAAIVAGAVLFVTASARVARAEDGKALYDKNCKSCHGESGKGDGPAAKALKPPPDPFAKGAKSMSEADIVEAIKGLKKHPPFGGKLNEEQLKAVAQYVKQLAGK